MKIVHGLRVDGYRLHFFVKTNQLFYSTVKKKKICNIYTAFLVVVYLLANNLLDYLLCCSGHRQDHSKMSSICFFSKYFSVAFTMFWIIVLLLDTVHSHAWNSVFCREIVSVQSHFSCFIQKPRGIQTFAPKTLQTFEMNFRLFIVCML